MDAIGPNTAKASSTSSSTRSIYWSELHTPFIPQNLSSKSRTVQWKNPVFQSTQRIAKMVKGEIPVTFTKSQIADIKIIGQVGKKFIACKLDDMLVLIDQHAADERVMLERYLGDYETKEMGDYGTSIASIRKHLSLLYRKHASSFTQFGITTKVTSSLPNLNLEITFTRPFLDLPDASTLITECLVWFDSITASPNMYSIPPPILDHFKSKACRNAIMFGDVLTMPECETLLTNLQTCDFPWQCAHGRPSMVPLISLPD